MFLEITEFLDGLIAAPSIFIFVKSAIFIADENGMETRVLLSGVPAAVVKLVALIPLKFILGPTTLKEFNAEGSKPVAVRIILGETVGKPCKILAVEAKDVAGPLAAAVANGADRGDALATAILLIFGMRKVDAMDCIVGELLKSINDYPLKIKQFRGVNQYHFVIFI